MSIEIRLLKESEYAAANDFYNNTPHIDRPAPLKARSYSEFCWEFIDCPNGKAIFAGAWQNEEGMKPALIGIQCVIILKMIGEDGRHLLSAKGESTLIDMRALIRYKKTDILKELFNILLEECSKLNIEFIWGFNNIPASYKRLGLESPFKSHHGIFILKPFKASKNIASLKSANSFWDTLKIGILSGLVYILSMKKKFVRTRKNNYYHFNTELKENETLFRSISSADKLTFLLQDANYLKWRVSNNPYPIVYKPFQLLDSERSLVAQVICSIQQDTAFIEQILFHKKITQQERLAFLKTVLNALESEKIGLVRYTGFTNNSLNKAEINLLKRIGFAFTGKGEWFTFKNLSSNPVIEPKNIYLSRMYKQGIN